MSNFASIYFSGTRVVPCWRTDGRTNTHVEANSRSSQFYKAFKKKNKDVCLFIIYTQCVNKRVNPLKTVLTIFYNRCYLNFCASPNWGIFLWSTVHLHVCLYCKWYIHSCSTYHTRGHTYLHTAVVSYEM